MAITKDDFAPGGGRRGYGGSFAPEAPAPMLMDWLDSISTPPTNSGQLVTAPSGPPPGALPTGRTPQQVAADAAAAADARARAEQKAAQDKANKEGKDRAKRENDATASLVDQQHSLLDSFGKQKDSKLENILGALTDSDRLLLENYISALGGLQGSLLDNDKAEADSTFQNIANAVRERQDILAEAASQGAGESDLLRTQLAALRNYSANQNEVNRSFFDTLRSANNSITGLNSDTATSRNNLYNTAESDRESAWANYYNQMSDTWTQIGNIENSNTNINSDSSIAYTKKYGNAGEEAAKAAAGSYKRQQLDKSAWDGKGSTEDRALTSSNTAATVNLSAPQKRPEGATLRKW